MRRIRFIVMLLAMGMPAAFAQAAQWQASLQPAQKQMTYTPTESLRMDLSAPLDERAQSRLSLEVDAIDVTAFAQIGATAVVFTPLQPFSVGRHRMRLVEYDDRGAMKERGAWTFVVASGAATADTPGAGEAPGAAPGTRRVATQLRADLAMGGAWRVADDNLPAPRPGRFSTEGSGSLGMTTQGEHWGTETLVELTEAGPAATAGAVNPGAAGGGENIQLGQFSVMAQSDSSRFMFGDQSLPYAGLVVSQLSRRGVSGDFRINPLRSRIGVFSMRSDAINGLEHGLGVGDPDHRVSGVVLDTHPFANAEALGLSFAYANGRGAPGGVSTFLPFATAPSGRALGVDLDSRLLGRQLHLHAALAQSKYDFGTPGLPERSDHARSVTLSYQPTALFGGAAPSVSSLTTLSHQSTGTYFRSLANPGITPDLEQWRLSQSLNGSKWSLQGAFGLDRDNVSDNPALATVHTRRLQLSAGFFPTPAEQPGWLMRWLGTPYYTLSLDASRSRNGHLPDPAYLSTDLGMSTLNASVQFSHTGWNWNTGLMYGRNTDHTGLQTSTRLLGLTWGVDMGLGESGNLGAAVQFSDTRDRGAPGYTRDVSYNLYARDELVRGRLTGQLNFSVTRTAQAVSMFVGTPLPGLSYNTRTASGSLLWHALAVRPNRPGIDLSLNGVWNHGGYPTVGGMPALPANTYQVFLKLNLLLPLRLPGGAQ